MSLLAFFKNSFLSSFSVLFIVAAVATNLAWPMVSLKWDIVDDGISLAGAQLIANALTLRDFTISEPLFLEYQFVRFRPIFWIAFWVIFNFFGKSVFYYHLVKVIMFVTTCVLVALITKLLTKSNTAALFTGLLYAVQPHDILNWYILGHHESFQNFFLSLCIVLIIICTTQKLPKLVRGVISSLLVITTIGVFWSKETSVALIPPLVYKYISLGKWRHFPWPPTRLQKPWIIVLLTAGISSSIMLATLKYLSLNQPAGYFSMYDVSNNQSIWQTAEIYRQHLLTNFSLLYILPLISFFTRLVYQKPNLNHWQNFFLFGHVSTFLILLPFSLRAENYYLGLSYLLYSLFIGMELAALIKTKNLALLLVSLTVFSYVLLRNFIHVNSVIAEYVFYHQADAQMMAEVVAKTPIAPKVLFNFAEADRGDILGIRIQRTAIFECANVEITDPNIIYGQESYCPLQTINYIPEKTSQISPQDYDLLVVGDMSHGSPVMPLSDLTSRNPIQLTKVAELSHQRTIISQDWFLPTYLIDAFHYLIANLRWTVIDRQWHMNWLPLPTSEIKSQWDLYTIQDATLQN